MACPQCQISAQVKKSQIRGIRVKKEGGGQEGAEEDEEEDGVDMETLFKCHAPGCQGFLIRADRGRDNAGGKGKEPLLFCCAMAGACPLGAGVIQLCCSCPACCLDDKSSLYKAHQQVTLTDKVVGGEGGNMLAKIERTRALAESQLARSIESQKNPDAPPGSAEAYTDQSIATAVDRIPPQMWRTVERAINAAGKAAASPTPSSRPDKMFKTPDTTGKGKVEVRGAKGLRMARGELGAGVWDALGGDTGVKAIAQGMVVNVSDESKLKLARSAFHTAASFGSAPRPSAAGPAAPGMSQSDVQAGCQAHLAGLADNPVQAIPSMSFSLRGEGVEIVEGGGSAASSSRAASSSLLQGDTPTPSATPQVENPIVKRAQATTIINRMVEVANEQLRDGGGKCFDWEDKDVSKAKDAILKAIANPAQQEVTDAILEDDGNTIAAVSGFGVGFLKIVMAHGNIQTD
mmetsp:Transcript_37685/g.96307  ORF Transcript_37685/g.96307 Transcript_37685/m.96307 type:complete len:461 (-) Transcript_37685:164-1546(-)